jgi:hypothetical protein
MKTLEELKTEVDNAQAAWNVADDADAAADAAAWDAYIGACAAYVKKLKEITDEDT